MPILIDPWIPDPVSRPDRKWKEKHRCKTTTFRERSVRRLQSLKLLTLFHLSPLILSPIVLWFFGPTLLLSFCNPRFSSTRDDGARLVLISFSLLFSLGVVWKYTTLISKLLVVAPGQRRRRSVLFVIRVLVLFIVLSSAAVALVLGVPRITKELTGWKVCADESSQFGDMRNIGNVHLAYKTVMEEQAQRDLNEVSSAKGLLTSTLVCWVFYSINAAICLVSIFVRHSWVRGEQSCGSGVIIIHVDTDKSELLVNNRFAYVSVSRAQHDAQIYTNDGSKLSHSLSRESSQRTAVEVEQQPAEPKTEPVSLSGVRPSEEEEGHSLGIGLA
jgi:hypothetical protein